MSIFRREDTYFFPHLQTFCHFLIKMNRKKRVSDTKMIPHTRYYFPINYNDKLTVYFANSVCVRLMNLANASPFNNPLSNKAKSIS